MNLHGPRAKGCPVWLAHHGLVGTDALCVVCPQNWCRQKMVEFFGNDDLAFVYWLLSLGSRGEVSEYCQVGLVMRSAGLRAALSMVVRQSSGQRHCGVLLAWTRGPWAACADIRDVLGPSALALPF